MQISWAWKKKNPIILPTPRWEIREAWVAKIMSDWVNQMIGDTIFARVPRVEQELIDNWELFVEFGLIRDKRYSNRALNTTKWRRITWYSSWVWSSVISWTGEWGWAHPQIAVDRPNRFPVLWQNNLHWELPRATFYKIRRTEHFDERNTIVTSDVPVVTGSKYWRIIDPSQFLPWQSRYKKRPQFQRFRDEVHQDSEWYARLVIVKNGRLESVWPTSEPLFIDVEWGYWFNNDWMDSNSRTMSPSNGEKQIPYIAHATIWHKYKH